MRFIHLDPSSCMLFKDLFTYYFHICLHEVYEQEPREVRRELDHLELDL